MWMAVSYATMQYPAGPVPTTLNSTVRIPQGARLYLKRTVSGCNVLLAFAVLTKYRRLKVLDENLQDDARFVLSPASPQPRPEQRHNYRMR